MNSPGNPGERKNPTIISDDWIIRGKMKRILIYDVAAEKTGAKAILDSYYTLYKGMTSVESFFVTSVLEYEGNSTLHNIRLPWAKKSKIHRIICDLFVLKRLVKKYKIDELVNLQNVAIKGLDIPQTLYLHNVIVFSEQRFSFIQDRGLWISKNIIGRMIVNNLRFADKVIVQAPWIKEKVIEKCGIAEKNIIVQRVNIPHITDTQRISTERVQFFYPANSSSYKNHIKIVEACKELQDSNIDNYDVIFTFKGESKWEKELIEMSKGLPIQYVGLLTWEEMIDYYKKSVLLFTSKLESVGLPLLEAEQFNAPIIAVDYEYARDTIGDYSKVTWIDPQTNISKSLAEKMKIFIN